MTAAEACELVVDLTRQLSWMTRQRDTHRLIAQQACHHMREQHVQLERLRRSYHALLDERRERRAQRAAA